MKELVFFQPQKSSLWQQFKFGGRKPARCTGLLKSPCSSLTAHTKHSGRTGGKHTHAPARDARLRLLTRYQAADTARRPVSSPAPVTLAEQGQRFRLKLATTSATQLDERLREKNGLDCLAFSNVKTSQA